MRETGGYLEAERGSGTHYHEGALRLQSARDAVWLSVTSRGWHTLCVPSYLCGTAVQRLSGVELKPYAVGRDLRPSGLELPGPGAAVLLVNYFGMYAPEEIAAVRERLGPLIVDNTQAFFQRPVPGTDTVYSCRKFFGVPDGGYLYAEGVSAADLPEGRSLDGIRFLFGRVEDGAQAHYSAFRENERRLDEAAPARMSRITDRMLGNIDYARVEAVRSRNYAILHEELGAYNALDAGAMHGWYSYPFLHPDGAELRRQLIANRVYVPLLWPDLRDSSAAATAESLVPLPLDQRYGEDDMRALARLVRTLLRERTDEWKI